MAHRQPPEDGLERQLREARDRRTAPLRQQAQRLLDRHLTRQPEAPPAKPVKLKKPKRYRTKSTSKAETLARNEINKLVTPEAQRNGDYQYGTIKLQEVTEAGHRVNKEVPGVRNVGSTPVERWHARGAFDERQWQAILKYIALYSAVFGAGPKLTSNYSPVIGGGQGSVERNSNWVADAKKILRVLDNEVFFREQAEHFWVWQNVLIFEEPGGVAGSRCGYSDKRAEAVAREIIRSMAWKVAEILVDQPLPRDMRDMLLDLDAARRPGRRG